MKCACAILFFMACAAALYFSTLSHSGTIFGKKLLHMKCVFWFSLQLLSEIFFIPRRNGRDMIVNAHVSSVKCRYSCQIWMKFEFQDAIKGRTGLLRTLGQGRGQGSAQRGTSHLMTFRHRHSDEIKECGTGRSWRKGKEHMQLWT